MSSEMHSGGKIGPRIAGIVGDEITRRKVAILPHAQRVAVGALNAFMDGIGAEARRTGGDLYDLLLAQDGLPAWARRMLEFGRRGHGQWAALMSHSILNGGVSQSVFALINNELAPVIQNAIAANPQGLLDVGTLAQGVARRIIDRRHAESDASKQGISFSAFDHMVHLAQTTPALADALDMLRRGIVNTDTVSDIFRDAGLRDDWWVRYLKLAKVELTPDQLAALVTFGVLTEEAAAPVAAKSGMEHADFHKLVLGNGQPPGLMELLLAHRRGIINDAQLKRGIEQGPVRNEWFPMILALSLGPPTPEAALSAATQNLLPEGEAKRIVADAGIDPKHFGWLLESNGRPLSIEEAATLYHRGKLSRAAATQMFLESSLKNKYVPHVFDLFTRDVPMDNVRMSYREGVISYEEALRKLGTLGFPHDDAVILLDQAAAQRAKPTKDLSLTTIRELWDDRAVSEATALRWVMSLGYDESEARWELELGSLRRARRIRDQAIGVVRARYVAHRINRTNASAALDRLRVPTDQRDLLMDAWDTDRNVTTARLSPTQIGAAVRRGIMNESAALATLQSYGYTTHDASVLLALSTPAAAP